MTLFFKHLLNSFINSKHKRFDAYNYYRENITKDVTPHENKGESILITNVVGAYPGHTFEGLYARKAILNGEKVYSLNCGNYLCQCEAILSMSSHKKIRCAVCQAQQEDFVKAFETTQLTYSMFITKEDERVMQKASDEFFANKSGEYVFSNVKIRKILFSALQRHYLMAEPKIKDDSVNRGFIHTILATLIVIDKIVKQIHPKYVLSSHGTYSVWGAIVEYCKSHGIFVITYGQNYNKNGLEFTYNDSYLTGDLNDTENKWAKKELSQRERNLAVQFLDERAGRINDDKVAFDYNKDNKKQLTREQICETLHIDKNKRIAALFPNIPWDGDVTGASNVFANFKEWLKETVEFFADRDDSVLVIRPHPAELLKGDNAGHETTATMLNELFATLPDTVRLLEPTDKINSYTLGENCDFAITYSTTLTLELTYLRVPVILCGCPPFKNKGIAFDVESKANYISLLYKGLRGDLIVDNDRIERLLKYMHYFFFMRTMPQTLVEIKDAVPYGYLFKRETELNEDPIFDELYRYIENKLPMNFSRFY